MPPENEITLTMSSSSDESDSNSKTHGGKKNEEPVETHCHEGYMPSKLQGPDTDPSPLTDDEEESPSKSVVESKEDFMARMTSNYVYIQTPNNDDRCWMPARVLEMMEDEEDPTNKDEGTTKTRKRAKVSIPIYQKEADVHCPPQYETKIIDITDYPNQTLPLQNVDEHGVLKEVEDMVDLSFLHEPALLYNLKARHIRGKPYTRTGDMVISCNPYKWNQSFYSEDTRQYYADSLVWNPSSSSTGLSHIEPHIYEVSAAAYYGLIRDRVDQSILVSGESGAGKTEGVKICLHHLASMQDGPSSLSEKSTKKPVIKTAEEPKRLFFNFLAPKANINTEESSSTSASASPIIQKVLDSNPLLEAFGNAQTVRNDNSSRFGKYIQLQFDIGEAIENHSVYAGKRLPQSVLAGSKCEVYLLEKTRVVFHEPNERTYHIFYQLLRAPNEIKKQFWSGLVDATVESFSYVGHTKVDTIEGMKDKDLDKTIESLTLVGVKGQKLTTLMRAICIVLQLGQLQFGQHEEDDSRSVLVNRNELDRLAQLMGVRATSLESSFLVRHMEVRGEKFQVNLNATKAKDACDAFAKEIYAQTFLWLVDKINQATMAERNYSSKTSSSAYGTIGLLDLSGFECFETNRFEQLCINYANEKLQQKFTEDTFRSVQAEYRREGIEFQEIKYDDNTHVLDLVEGKMGLLALLNEECIRPGGSDRAFVQKALKANTDSACLFRERSFGHHKFGIRHYAGPVVYLSEGFVNKNTDTLPTDLQLCAKQSSNRILSQCMVIESPPEEESTQSSKLSVKTAPCNMLLKKGSNLIGITVWTKFRSQLTQLMETIGRTRSRYIRCIKPNNLKLPNYMQHKTTVDQLRSAGVVAAVTIARSAFPNFFNHSVILDRFKCLWINKDQKEKATTEATKLCNGDPTARSKTLVDHLLTEAMKDLSTIAKKTQGNDEDEQSFEVTKPFVLGHTRVYFRQGSLEFLENLRIKRLGYWASQIQRIARGFLAKQKRKRTWFLIGQLAFSVPGQQTSRQTMAPIQTESHLPPGLLFG